MKTLYTQKIKDFIPFILFPILIAGLLILISQPTQYVEIGISYAAATFIALLISQFAWKSIRDENPPSWLKWLVLGAVLLRLAASLLWMEGLPIWGHDNEMNQAGYVMSDAFVRDQAAWELAQSEEPLTTAFLNISSTDQYGGMLFFSALVYRYLGTSTHLPLLILIFTSFFSSLGILFTWAICNKYWGQKSAGIAAGLLALYPEAVFLGSTQMREAFTISLAPMVLYFALHALDSKRKISFFYSLAGLAITYLLSVPTAITLLLFLILLFSIETNLLQNRKQVLILIIFTAISSIVLYTQFDFVRHTINYQSYLREQDSGVIQLIFDTFPSWTHTTLIVGFGFLEPFLPAAIGHPTAPLWKFISISRALGWIIYFTLFIFATISSLQKSDQKSTKLLRGLIAFTWLYLLISSIRGGGDMWDNPRYRSVITCFQIISISWSFNSYNFKKYGNFLIPIIGFAFIFQGWISYWYLPRYGVFAPQVPIGVIKSFGLGIFHSLLFIIWWWAKSITPSENK